MPPELKSTSSRDCIIACQPPNLKPLLDNLSSNDSSNLISAKQTATVAVADLANTAPLSRPKRSLLGVREIMMPQRSEQNHVFVVLINNNNLNLDLSTPLQQQTTITTPTILSGDRLGQSSSKVLASIGERHSIEKIGFIRYWGEAYSEVWKINLSLNVVLTTLAGWGITSTVEGDGNPTAAQFDAGTDADPAVVRNMISLEMASLLLGTLLQSCAAMAMNQILERHRDGMMSRTKMRPLPSGRMSVRHAWIQSSIACAAGTTMLYFGTNPLTAELGFLNFLFYVFGYTPLKTIHWSNTWFGSIVGAIPPIMGFTAATCQLPSLRVLLWGSRRVTTTDLLMMAQNKSVMGAWILAAILFLWQIPHFLSLSSTYRTEYERAGYKMLGVQSPKICAIASCAHSLLMVPLCLAAPYYGVVHWSFAPISLLLNSHLVYHSIVHMWHWDKPSQARKLFIASLINLSALSVGLLMTSVKTLDFAKSCVRWLFS